MLYYGQRGGLRHARRRGNTVILTMIFLVLFTALAVGFSYTTNMNLQQARNYKCAQSARMAAESGLGYMLSVLEGFTIPAKEADEDLLLAVANALAYEMDTTPNMGGGEITFDGTTIRTPVITYHAHGQAFQASISETGDGDGTLHLAVNGSWRGFQKRVGMEVSPVTVVSTVFNYGIASKGKVSIGGQGSIVGANDPSDADILAATYTSSEAAYLYGGCVISGDISTSNPDSYVTITGSASVGGTSNPLEILDHIHIGVGDPVFPEIDTSVFEPFATNTLSPTADTSGDIVLENIRVPAGMNPIFDGKVTLRGVVHIEQPNNVQFAGQVEITGVITTDAGNSSFDNKITCIRSRLLRHQVWIG